MSSQQTAEARLVALHDVVEGLGAPSPAEPGDAWRSARLLTLQTGPGELDPRALEGCGQARGPVAGLVITDGLIAADVAVAGQVATRLLGPGDLLAASASQEDLLPVVRRHVVITPTQLFVVDDRFLAVSQRWPRITHHLLRGAAEQLERAAVQQLISQLARVEHRVLALMWYLASRWGQVTPQGLVLNLELTHAALGRLVGAKRPTVSLALKHLGAEGALRRRTHDGAWLLNPETASQLGVGPALPATTGVAAREPLDPDASRIDAGELMARLERVREEQRALGERTATLLETVAAGRAKRASPPDTAAG